MQAIQLVPDQDETYPAYEVATFSGADGVLTAYDSQLKSLITDTPVPCKLLATETGKSFWRGPVRLSLDAQGRCHFTLLLQPNEGDPVNWGDLPPFFSVADGGYEALSNDQIGIFLDDLLRFQNVTTGVLFPNSSAQDQNPINCSPKMEALSATDAILLSFEHTPSSQIQSDRLPSIVSITLFEETYILIGFIEGIDEKYAVLSLTAHIYQDKRRAGRKFLSPPINTSVGDLIEVSDFGCRLVLYDRPARACGDTIELELPGEQRLKCSVIHIRHLGPTTQELGCMVKADPISLSTWNRFLLREQYPLLRYRNRTDRNSYRQLLSETGYINRDLSELNELIQPSVDHEWDYIDDNCPLYGATVVAQHNDLLVGTIGVTRVGKNAWTAQVAAMSKDPSHIDVTRSLYSWRTRFILQQPDGEYHVAFFQRDKPFLDRFFRKFYLQEKDKSQSDIIWEEWRLFTHILPKRETNNPPKYSAPTEHLSKLFSTLGTKSENNSAPDLLQIENIQILKGRPFQHLCQYLTSAWVNTPEDIKAFPLVLNALGDQQVFTVRTKDEGPLNYGNASPGRTIDDGWDIVWSCHRRLLPKFLSNSLRSLEIMNRKYGAQSVA